MGTAIAPVPEKEEIKKLTRRYESYPNELVTLSRMKSNGWTDRTIKLHLGDPDQYAPNPHYKCAPNMCLYKIDRIVAVEESGVEWEGRRQSKDSLQSAQQRRFARFDKKYAAWKDALPEACEILFNLNRYVKHDSCMKDHRAVIYDLKNKIIQLLYQGGYCSECYHHTFETDERECWRCDGTGIHWTETECRNCSGTGIFRLPETLAFVVFRFLVNDVTYTWHQPEENVMFPYGVTSEQSEWKPSLGEKPVSLSPKNFEHGKDLLRWIIAKTVNTEQQKRLFSVQISPTRNF